MKLVDLMARAPVHVSFGRRGSGITAIRGASSVTLFSDSGATAEIPAADAALAGMMTAADRAAMDAMAGAVAAPVFATRAAAELAALPAGTTSLRLAGRATAGDGGGASYRRVGAQPGHPGRLQTADGAWWEIAEPRIFAEMLGARGDGTTDNTVAIADALKVIEAQTTGGYLHFGPGIFVTSTNPFAGGRTKCRGIVGERDKTMLRAPSAGSFALVMTADREFKVASITFDGTVGGVTRRGCGIYHELRIDVVDCRFQNCLIGYARQNAFYGVIDRCRFQSNDLAIFAGTRATGTETIAGLRDGGGAAQSVTLPAPGNVNGHAGNFAVTNTHIQQNRIGVAILPTSSGCPHVRFDKVTIEGHSDIGVVAARLGATFQDCWTEANQGTSDATISLDGRTVNKGNLVLVDPHYATPGGAGDFADEGGSRITYRGGAINGLRTAARGDVRLDAADLTGDPSVRFSTAAGGSLTAETVYADGISVPALLASAPLPALGRSRGLNARLPMPKGRIWSAQPGGGSVRVASDFADGAGYGSARIATWHGGTRSFGAAGGFWNAAATCLEIVHATGGTVGFRASDPLGTGAPAGYYALVLAFRADQASPQLTINGPGGPWAGSNVPVPGGGRWTCFGGCWLVESAGEMTPIVGITGDLVNPLTVRFGAFALMRFETRGDAESWFKSGLLHLAEE